MEYFVYCRDRSGTWDLRLELTEEHWSFMDRYAEEMIARGPTLTPDGERTTGSMHIVDLPDLAAAREFAFEEPNYQAGIYGEVLIRRWRNVLGRTMWEFEGEKAGDRRFLIIAHGEPSKADDSLDEAHREYLDGGYADRLIAHGPLLSEDGTDWAGNAILVELPDRSAAEAMMANDPHTKNGSYKDIEIHPWQFGGRPSS
ncbi:hypothetical protein BZB76_2225 [Actinomadura pelletieri DSM 43383]|uniref:YCII-related domain-containing protein n=1 Tax=Actinomadura pelletieri DSM 43383 TaxID=1120940 RepID=A0A495QTQ0_9ACTN|nr:YciI family protein [Actinomadura pelletieri]RKS76859.1 hypothetical protein BZB76_2225 [Actinomadura pelletieri DSM 43383]